MRIGIQSSKNMHKDCFENYENVNDFFSKENKMPNIVNSLLFNINCLKYRNGILVYS